MADENNKKRIDDKRAPGSLQWDGEGAGEAAVQAEQSQSAGSARQGGITILEGLKKYWFDSSGMVVVDSKSFGGFYRADDVAAAIASQSQAAQLTTDSVRESVRDAVAQALTGIYHCGRAWSAWGYGTMREDDFTPAAEVDDVLSEITDAAIAAHIAGTSQATNAQAEPSKIIITLRQALRLVDFFGSHDTSMTVMPPAEHWEQQEPGLYAYCTEYPEDGSEYLGPTEVDDDLARFGVRGVQARQAALPAKTWKDSPYKLDHVGEAWARGWNEARASLAAPVAKEANQPQDLSSIIADKCAEIKSSGIHLWAYRPTDAQRYERLRVLGAAPAGSKQLAGGTVLRCQSLDDFVDADIAEYPSRGEVAKEAEKEQQAKPIAAAVRAAERVDAMHKGVVGVFAAIKAEHIEQAHVMPPMRGTGSQRDADAAALVVVKGLSGISMALAADLVQGVTYTFEGRDYLDRDAVVERVMKWRSEWDATRSVREEVARRGRAQGGNTSKENGSDVAPTTSTVSAPTGDAA